MLAGLRSAATRWVFGGGIGGELADRGIDWLLAEGKEAWQHQPQQLTTARLSPGETLTVVARPRATRAERRLAARSAALEATERKLSRPTRRQLRAARRLRSAQRRLDRRRPGSRAWRRARSLEARRGQRFDRVMAPNRRLSRVRVQRTAVTSELSARRAASLAAVRERRGTRRETVAVYD